MKILEANFCDDGNLKLFNSDLRSVDGKLEGGGCIRPEETKASLIVATAFIEITTMC